VKVMVKNKLEKELSKAIRENTKLWGMKLQNNPLAHTNTPGDFILDYYKHTKQHHDLMAFDKLRESHQAFYLISYLDKNFFRDAHTYLVPVKVMDEVMKTHHNVSLNRDDAYKYLIDYKINDLKNLRRQMI